jgi:hypothetical protein
MESSDRFDSFNLLATISLYKLKLSKTTRYAYKH